MILYDQYREEYDELVTLTSRYKQIPESAIRRDYLIVETLEKLLNNEYSKFCVFKGGTSLSKCYPGTIERFSEDIDLTYIPHESLSDKQYERILKNIESIMSKGLCFEKITEERKQRSKSSYIWKQEKTERIKLEIGSSIRPEPYSKRSIKTYIHEFLEFNNSFDDIAKYELNEISLNVLDVSRTFIDKIMAVKRHALCGTLVDKVRHIYDVVRLYQTDEINKFIEDKQEFKKIVKITKETDSFYLEKRSIPKSYNPLGSYNFVSWSNLFNDEIKKIYEGLHIDLLYTNEKQDFNIAVNTFNEINQLLQSINE